MVAERPAIVIQRGYAPKAAVIDDDREGALVCGLQFGPGLR